tara:strand:- start:5961 stop:6599 length:639 start_codon:yes stop_codon:yes gene_type:complete
MAYYLGRDVIVALTTEDTGFGLQLDVSDGGLQTFATGAGPEDAADLVIGGGRAGSVFGTVTGTTRNYSNEISDLVGVDLSIGTIDEDITYMGQRSVLKAEIKKETTITLTMKKSDMRWDKTFNGDGTNSGRYGIKGTGSFHTGLEDPGVADFGYRVYIKLNSGEYFMAPNCCIQAHTVTLNADGTTEETLEFMTYLDPIIGSAVSVADAGAF